MQEVITVDFKAKKRVNSFTSYPWRCGVCTKTYVYDSRNVQNTKRVVISYGKNPLNICQDCIVNMNDIIGDVNA